MKRFVFLSIFLFVAAGAVGEPVLTLHSGDHIAIVGNALADRMQHSGYLESLIQSRFPEHNLSFRNLGFSGDEVKTRLRSAGFGSPAEWLTRAKADVVLAFFLALALGLD